MRRGREGEREVREGVREVREVREGVRGRGEEREGRDGRGEEGCEGRKVRMLFTSNVKVNVSFNNNIDSPAHESLHS